MPTLTFAWDLDGFERDLAQLGQAATEAVRRVVQATTQRAAQNVRRRTPRDTGRAVRGWTTSSANDGLTGLVANDVPYINVLEFGGYPVRPARGGAPPAGSFRRGNAFLGGYPPRHDFARTVLAPGGEPAMTSNVSRQAQHGMVRATLADLEFGYVANLEQALDHALGAL